MTGSCLTDATLTVENSDQRPPVKLLTTTTVVVVVEKGCMTGSDKEGCSH
jgi:hypothetical protein